MLLLCIFRHDPLGNRTGLLHHVVSLHSLGWAGIVRLIGLACCLIGRSAGKEVHRSRDMLDSGGIVLFEAAGRDCTITVVDYPGNSLSRIKYIESKSVRIDSIVRFS